MNKKELAAKLAKKVDLPQTKAMEIITAIFDSRPGHGIIAVELDAGRKVTIPGFGTFGTRTRPARTGTNPTSGKKIDIPKRTYAFFRPGKTLRDRVST